MSELTGDEVYGPPPDEEISAEVWAFVHAQYKRPTTDRSFYTFSALVEQRHRREVLKADAQSPSEQVGDLIKRALALAPSAGLYLSVKIEPAKVGRKLTDQEAERADMHSDMRRMGGE